MKMAKCISELEKIYGIRQGSANEKGMNQHIGDGNNFAHQKSQEDLAKQIGIDQRQLQNYKKLNELIPELQSLVETGVLKSTTENENRKDFSFSEKMQWAEQLKEEYSKIAKENQANSTGGINPQLRQNSAKAEKIRTDDKVSQDVGLGSRDTYRKAKYIYENGNNELIQQLDDEQLSINKIIDLYYHHVSNVMVFLFVCFV
ncbi:hypothetical protein [Clostridium sporogenes]|uniref:hypothetical protein n=1 Tax=Clostridium sporogenes TaxID=1509 RepID=UPI001FAE63E6|nr:hypothetical protein [Clostridium sporogenes]